MEESCFDQAIVEHTSVGYSYNKILYNAVGEPEDYQFLKVNKTYEGMLGIEEKDWIGRNVSALYSDLNYKDTKWSEYQKNILKQSRDNEFEKVIAFQGKHYRMRMYSPNEDYMITSLADISKEQKKTENLQTLFDSVPIQVWYLKDPWTYRSANKAHADFIGMKSGDIIEGSIKDWLNKQDAEIYIQENKEVFEKKEQIISEEWLTSSRGDKRLLRITKKPKFNEDGEVVFVICSAEDITEDYTSELHRH